MKRTSALLIVVLVALWGCSADDGGLKDDTQLKVGKGDCPDCDPHGGSAFEQADMGLRFYAVGDAWKFAWQFKVRNDMAREALTVDQLPDDPSEFPMVQEDRQVSISAPFLFEYSVLKVDQRKLDNVIRDVARIRIEQAAGATADLYSQDRLDRHEFALEFELDDLLRPLRETFFNRQYPHGKVIEVEKISALSGLESGPSLFPHVVPRVLVADAADAAPAMTPELEAIADAQSAGWRDASYRKYEFANGDLVYWAKGQVWPFYMDTQQGFGLLVSQTLVAR